MSTHPTPSLATTGANRASGSPSGNEQQARSRQGNRASATERDFEERCLRYLDNPRISVAQRLSLAEYLAGVPTEERTDRDLRTELEIEAGRRVLSRVYRQDIAQQRRAALAALAGHTEHVPVGIVTVGDYRQDPYPHHDKRSTADRATVIVTESRASHPVLPRWERLAAAGPAQARQQHLAVEDWRKRDNSGACGKAPQAFSGEERFGVLRARSEAARYVPVTDDSGVYSHSRLATAQDREVTSRTRESGTMPSRRIVEEQGCAVLAPGYGGVLEVTESVCSHGFPAPDAALSLTQEALDRRNAVLADTEARLGVVERLSSTVARDVTRAQESQDRRLARHLGEERKRGSSRRGKRNRGKGSKAAPTTEQSR